MYYDIQLYIDVLKNVNTKEVYYISMVDILESKNCMPCCRWQVFVINWCSDKKEKWFFVQNVQYITISL